MLVLTREVGGVIEIRIPPSDKERRIMVYVTRVQDSRVRIGFEADPDVKIVRDNAIKRT